MSVSLPARMTEVFDEIGPGAFLKRMTDDVGAILIDYIAGQNGGWIVAMTKKRFRDDDNIPEKEDDCLPTKPKHYVFKKITNTDEWIVLSKGGDLLLVE